MSEKILQNRIIKHLKMLEQKGSKIFWEKRQAGGWNYRTGIPDLYVVVNGVHLEVELKSPNRKINKKTEQEFWENKFTRIGIPYLITNDFDEFVAFINKFGDKNE